MAVHIFSGNIIAVIWDFDQTLIPGYQQSPIFAHYNITERDFWNEVNTLPEYYRKNQSILVSPDTAYLSHILTYVREGKMPGLNNENLRKFGAKLDFYPGLPEFFPEVKRTIEEDKKYSTHGIKVEHYIVSTGLRQVILGSRIAEYVEDIWACEFIENVALPGFTSAKKTSTTVSDSPTEISQIAYFLDNTTKTRAIWEINKGTNKDPNVGVNHLIAVEDRRVPIRNMLYVADGPSDIPVFSILNQYGGRTLGVYNKSQRKHFIEVKRLGDQGRVHFFSEADYSSGSQTNLWIVTTLQEIADSIVKDRNRLLADNVGKPASHVISTE
jgi:hypothetical protein